MTPAPDWSRLAVAAALALAIVAFVVAVFGLGEENRLIQAFDVRVVLPDQMGFLKQAMLDGRLPLWNPHVYSGMPFLASPPTQVFYPTSLLFLWLEPHAGIVIQFVLHLLLAAVGTYLLARVTYGISPGASILAALLYALSGRVVGHAFAGHSGLIMALAYIPLLAFIADRAIDRLETAQASLTRGRSGSAAHVWLGRFMRAGPWPFLGALLLGLQLLTGGLPMVWLGLFFVGLLRVAHVLDRGPSDWRAWSREAVILGSIVMIGVLLAAVQLLPSYELAMHSDRPRDFGYATAGSFESRFFLMMFHPRAILEGKLFYWEFYGYLGILPLVLAGLGISRIRKDRRIFGLTVIGGFMILFMMGKNSFVFPVLWKFVPTFDLFRIPARAMVIVHLVIALLAGVGLDFLIRSLRSVGGIILKSVPLVIAGICIVTWLDIVGAARWYERWLFTPVTADLVTNADSSSPSIIASRARHARILEEDRSWYRYWFDAHNLPRNYGYRIGARHIGGYDVLMLKRYSRFLHYMTGNGFSLRFTFAEPIFFDSPVAFPFKILGLKYADNAGKLWIQNDPEAVSRGWFVGASIHVADEQAALEYMHGSRFRPRSEVVFEVPDAPVLEPGDPDAGRIDPVPVTITDLSPDELVIQVGPRPNGTLVLSEIWYPGWQAEADGRAIPVHRCNSILRCLKLDAADEPLEIRMRFRPATLRWGAAVSIVSLLIVILVLSVVRRRTIAGR